MAFALVQAHEHAIPGSEPQSEDAVVMELSGATDEPVELYVTASGSAADPHHEDVLIHLQFLNPSKAVWLDVYAEPHVSSQTLTSVMTDAIEYCRSSIGPLDWVVKTGCYGGD